MILYEGTGVYDDCNYDAYWACLWVRVRSRDLLLAAQEWSPIGFPKFVSEEAETAKWLRGKIDPV